MNCVVLFSSHLVPHSLSLKFIGIGQERVLSMVYVGHSCSMCSGSCVPVLQGRKNLTLCHIKNKQMNE